MSERLKRNRPERYYHAAASLKFKVGDKAIKPKGYAFPCTIVGVFTTLKGDIRIVGEMNEFGLLHIFNENQLEKDNE